MAPATGPSQTATRDRTTHRRKLLSGIVGCEVEGSRLSRKTYRTVTATLFLVVAIMHLLRIIFGWQVEIGGLSIPFWVSWLALPVAGALAYFGFMQNR
jgi:hypothetical protein